MKNIYYLKKKLYTYKLTIYISISLGILIFLIEFILSLNGINLFTTSGYIGTTIAIISFIVSAVISKKIPPLKQEIYEIEVQIEKLIKEQDIEKEITPKITFYSEPQRKYESKNLITENEKYFYKIIENHFGNEYKIQTQVNLASIIEKTTNEKYRNELFRNIDIGIFTKELEPLLLIEIDDETHKQPNRRYRDVKVKEICEEAGIKLIKFYSYMSNKEEYIINRINEELARI